MTRKRKLTGARHQLGPELFGELSALCEALVGNPPMVRVIRQAVRAFIKAQIADRGVRERYEAALKAQRGGTEGDNVVVLPQNK
jgi:hypothetical protein